MKLALQEHISPGSELPQLKLLEIDPSMKRRVSGVENLKASVDKETILRGVSPDSATDSVVFLDQQPVYPSVLQGECACQTGKTSTNHESVTFPFFKHMQDKSDLA